MTDYESLDLLIAKEMRPLEKRIEELTRERDKALAEGRRLKKDIENLLALVPQETRQVYRELQTLREKAQEAE